MKSAQIVTDKLAIGLSALCAIHCLVLPLLLVMIPSLVSLNLHDEAFHFWLAMAIFPSSIFALTLGCRKHKRYQLLVIGGIGLMSLMLALVLGESHISEFGEKALTLLGGGFVALAHWLNYSMCRAPDHQTCEHSGRS